MRFVTGGSWIIELNLIDIIINQSLVDAGRIDRIH